ncbi:flavocytochrome c [Faecalibacterium sp. An121]|uniref:flavocytochrome c n=1 Tax=Faecalibacterium sp. An121 TaxID=1965550 RepID=UPI000B3A0AC0|nr:flavocytochrome c [Faecalibacterium sp. An121]
MRKRIAALALAAVMAFGLAGCGGSSSSTAGSAQSGATGVSGEFTGTAQGMGEVTVTVTLTDGAITGCVIEGPDETEGIGSVVLENAPDEIVSANKGSIDVVAGATITSNAVNEALAAALAAAGLDAADFTGSAAEGQTAEDKVIDTDVVVVGAGGAGMTAAITAAQAGRNVVVLESQAMVGGNSVRATGGLNATKTPAQDKNEFNEAAGVEATLAAAAADYADNETITALAETVAQQWADYQANPVGYFDSVELMELDTMIGGHGVNDPALVETLCSNSADAIAWLAEQGIDMPSVSSFGGASVKRIHRPLDDEGKVISVGSYMIPRLEDKCEEEGVEILLNTTATKILTDAEGAAVGIEATDNKTGGTVTVNAKAVILATGGFGANLDMVVEYKPDLAGFMTTNAAGAQGQGIDMAVAIGAGTVDMDQIQIHPTVEANTAALITEGLRGDGAILVNAEGNRFTDEVGTRDVVSAAEIAQTGSYSWLIIDQAMADASSVIQGYINNGYTVTGETYEELAGAMGVDPAAFTATMEKWNAAVAAGVDEEFGRTSFANPLDTAPYYAIKVTAGIHHTMGGLTINPQTQVLAGDGSVIAGLYAAGEVTGGVHGANRLGGNAVADFTVFGRIAGQQAADYAA